MGRRRKRCKCHHKDKKKGTILFCDVLLGLFVLLCGGLLLVYVVLPYFGTTLDLSIISKVDYRGLWVAMVGVGLNIFWAVYYGCQKSFGGVGLSVATAVMVGHSYGII
jgi:hypothetical protein